ncbi:hypothetical protein IGI04_019479 [Brassica rapa subsp. trilocularis]|uniref:Uncharacterized protein n=3 Tax=Brassica TaxID=3705 RepID=M4D105_BRACM|nr:hypothetical protein IGI04_019479 [Brassica rapa subsp. trilocularis]CAF2098979.1 unnamed protein product [Brassica napus]CDY53286.1 BnaA05g35960D [Brassica napus]
MKLRRDRHWKLSSSGFTATESLKIGDWPQGDVTGLARPRLAAESDQELDMRGSSPVSGFCVTGDGDPCDEGHGGDAIIGFDLLSSKPSFMNPSKRITGFTTSRFSAKHERIGGDVFAYPHPFGERVAADSESL